MTKMNFLQKKIKKSNFYLLSIISILLIFNSCALEGQVRTVDKLKNIYVVDINARSTSKDKPLSIELDAGTYLVKSIGIADGGAYDAWKPWFYSPKKDDDGNWKMGWINKYSFSSSEFEEVTCSDDLIYETSLMASAHAQNSQFTLRNKSWVSFYINDSPRIDNCGGVSLRISPVYNSEN